MERGTGPEAQRLRALCLALPETFEKLSHGEPTWWVRRRSFVKLADHHHDDRVSAWLAAPEGEQAALVASDAVRYFVPPYVGHSGWVGAHLDVDVDWPALEDLVESAWRTVAPVRLAATLDESVRRGDP